MTRAASRRDVPGREAEISRCDSEHCITCGDVAVVLRVVEVDPDRGLAICAAADGGLETVETALVEPVSIADELLVHARTAIARVEDDRDRDTPGGEAQEAPR